LSRQQKFSVELFGANCKLATIHFFVSQFHELIDFEGACEGVTLEHKTEELKVSLVEAR
jgi:hypothetical protein